MNYTKKNRFQSVPIAALCLYNIQRENLAFKNSLCMDDMKWKIYSLCIYIYLLKNRRTMPSTYLINVHLKLWARKKYKYRASQKRLAGRQGKVLELVVEGSLNKYQCLSRQHLNRIPFCLLRETLESEGIWGFLCQAELTFHALLRIWRARFRTDMWWYIVGFNGPDVAVLWVNFSFLKEAVWFTNLSLEVLEVNLMYSLVSTVHCK